MIPLDEPRCVSCAGPLNSFERQFDAPECARCAVRRRRRGSVQLSGISLPRPTPRPATVVRFPSAGPHIPPAA